MPANFNIMKKVILYAFILGASIGYSQSNLIPNGDFESVPSGSGSSCHMNPPNNTNPPGTFNNSVNNWKTAIHNNGSSSSSEVGQISLVNTAVCGALNGFGANGCGAFPNLGNTGSPGTNFALLRANYTNCNLTIKKQYGAIGVALSNASVFDNGKTYVVRYKIVPLASRNLANHGGDFCSNDNNEGLHCHIRFFLSKNTPPTWNSGAQQELYSVNFQKTLSTIGTSNATPCDWQQEERVFTCNAGNYSSLIIYAESGGAAIDDVEIFERCENYVLVQNKSYIGTLFQPGAVSGYNMGEKAGDYVIAGKNITSSKPQGDVYVGNYSKVNFTAPTAVILKDGFSAYSGSNFKAALLSCPNSLNRSTGTENLNVNPDPDYVPAPPMKRDDELKAEAKYEAIVQPVISKIYPNPAQASFMYSSERIEAGSTFNLVNILGQTAYTKTIVEDTGKLDFDISELPKGIYLLNRYNSEGQLLEVKKVVKD